VRHKCVPIPGHEGGHPKRVRVALLLEEDREIALGHIPQSDIARQRGWWMSRHVVLAMPPSG